MTKEKTYGESHYTQAGYANKTTRWIPGDHEEKFLRNLSQFPERMAYNGWDGPRGEFTYRFNSAGFRSEEFSDEPSVMFLGCSMTMGVGIEEEKTWAYTVARDLGLRNHNLATGASSNDACFRLFMHWHRIHKPKIVIHYSPPSARMEVIDVRGDIQNHLPHFLLKGRKLNPLFEQWISNDINTDMNMLKNKLAIQHVCAEQGIKYVWMEHMWSFNTNEGYEYDKEDIGRDLLHPGLYWHRNMHKRVMSLL